MLTDHGLRHHETLPDVRDKVSDEPTPVGALGGSFIPQRHPLVAVDLDDGRIKARRGVRGLCC